MALRVLLADESVTIKKVIQLALQDFAVEVKAVPVGLDVLEVSKSFQPDLVFADILLQKRSGYEVCADLKKDQATAAIPVVLMWSSFMELDQRQVDSCGADGRLEKPFEVEALRKLVLELVPRTRSQRLAHFLDYPATVAAPLRNEVRPPPPKSSPAGSQVKAPLGAPNLSPPLGAPKLPPPLGAPKNTGAGLAPSLSSTPASRPASTTRSAAPNPFASSLGAKETRPAPPKPAFDPGDIFERETPPANAEIAAPSTSTNLPSGSFLDTPTSFTRTPGIPERPAAPLGALPDLQLEGSPPTTPTSSGGGWNMESFEPLDLEPLNLGGDDDEDESFKPIQLPQAEPASPRSTAPELTLGDDDDADADQWANRSLDKYRMAPLKPDESLAVDDLSGNIGDEFVADSSQTESVSRGQFDFNQSMPSLTTDKTELIAPNVPKKKLTAPPPQIDAEEDESEMPEFSLSDDDFDNTSRLEIEHITQKDKTRPAIVRELLRDPDFSYGDETIRNSNTASTRDDRTERAAVNDDFVVDLSSSGKPSLPDTETDRIEKMVRTQITPQLEKMVERAIEKTVAQMLPQIAERIIKRELERLLEET